MKTLLLPLLLISATVSAQKGDKRQALPKPDTTKVFKLKEFKELPVKADEDLKNPYKMLTAIPKDTSAYLALKEAKKDDSKYKILNASADKPVPDPKKAVPSK
ncbi:hypothetical protein [Chryseobacterium kwangjuense]|uniref:Uncharacterized protein n=1 Tax=Chryseobacterium kwangjuense TaxID=267125 RepID=A0A135W027_9FLAO|nr:hypothetical protein [Chryseobacterium kwangjuense]KXH78280.1 hypothetical protein AU378_22440 [Chryseobacterium kwangjuense]